MANYKKLLIEYADQGLTLNQLCRDHKIGKRSLYAAIRAHDCVREAHEYHRLCMIERGLTLVENSQDAVELARSKYLAEARYKVSAPFLSDYDNQNLAVAAHSVRTDAMIGDVSASDAKILIDAIKSEMDVRKGTDLEVRINALESISQSDDTSMTKFAINYADADADDDVD